MRYPRRKFVIQSLAASAMGMLSPLKAIPAMDQSRSQVIPDHKERREKLFSLLGDLPGRYSPAPPKLLRREQHDGYTLEYLDFDFNGLERVPGILLIPDGLKKKAMTVVRTSFWDKAYKKYILGQFTTN